MLEILTGLRLTNLRHSRTAAKLHRCVQKARLNLLPAAILTDTHTGLAGGEDSIRGIFVASVSLLSVDVCRSDRARQQIALLRGPVLLIWIEAAM